MKQAITKTIKTGIATSIVNKGLSIKYPWLNSPEDFNFDPLVNIAHRIYNLTGLTLSCYTLESDNVNWKHTFIFPFVSAFPHELNMNTLCNTMKTAVTSEFGDEASVVLKGVGTNLRLIITI